MKLKAIVITVILCGLALGIISAANANAATARAFLAEPADNISAVINQVEGNRLVALRYAKHFGTSPSSVLVYFRNELAVTTLKEPLELTVYYVDSSLSIASETRLLKAGTKVFANKIGTPVLEVGTGNPLTTSLTTVGGISPAAPVVAQSAPVAPPEQPSVISDHKETIAPLTEPAAKSSGTSLTSILLPVGIGGAVAAIAGGGSNSTSFPITPTQPRRDEDEAPNVIPEPTGLLALGTGLITFCGLFYRRGRSAG